ncbi:MAG: hypothetical protein GF320_07155 [Armatimonadia bacterium]|nr:hypothetical protein [Armatimonadia bacterium]
MGWLAVPLMVTLAADGGTPLRWGFDDAGGPPMLHEMPWAGQALDELGFDTWIMHYLPMDPDLDVHPRYIREADAWCGEHGIDWVSNLEHANWMTTFVDERGRDWFRRDDGRHFHLFPDDILAELARAENLLGLMYDEPAHMQNSANMISGADRPFMLDPEGIALAEASDAFTEAAAEIARIHERHGIHLYTEHVLPNMLHNYARAGYTPAPKILKESWSPVMMAIAMGAALQYERELWVTPDLWGVPGYPGHSVDEYRSALLLAYHLGADCIYTENLAFDHEQRGIGSLILVTGDGYRITEYGQVTRSFRKEYVPSHPRHYRFQDVRPRTAIIRREDGCWGQDVSWLPNTLFGNPAWPVNDTTRAWQDIWHLLTRDTVDRETLTWHGTPTANRPHQVFCPLDGVIVFDDHVTYDRLEGVETIFLTGVGVSPQTLLDVQRRVREGATCIALPHLAPLSVRAETGSSGYLEVGEGRWVVTESFLSDQARAAAAGAIPDEDVIRYRFGQTTVELRPIGGDPNRLEVDVSG